MRDSGSAFINQYFFPRDSSTYPFSIASSVVIDSRLVRFRGVTGFSIVPSQLSISSGRYTSALIVDTSLFRFCRVEGIEMLHRPFTANFSKVTTATT